MFSGDEIFYRTALRFILAYHCTAPPLHKSSFSKPLLCTVIFFYFTVRRAADSNALLFESAYSVNGTLLIYYFAGAKQGCELQNYDEWTVSWVGSPTKRILLTYDALTFQFCGQQRICSFCSVCSVRKSTSQYCAELAGDTAWQLQKICAVIIFPSALPCNAMQFESTAKHLYPLGSSRDV